MSNVHHFILATAGHVDHCKSALVKALTGTDPDRLPEETLTMREAIQRADVRAAVDSADSLLGR